MNRRPSASMKIRCYNCQKIFVVNLVKEQDISDGNKVEISRPCPYCGKDNVFEVEVSIMPAKTTHRNAKIDIMHHEVTFDTIYREVIPGRKVK